jgi:hypothetical protein
LGDHEFGLRSFSAFAGVLTVAATMALGRWLAGRRLALVAGFLTAVHPALVYYSQETRMYALLGLWAVLSTLFLLRVEIGDWRLESDNWQLTINNWQLTIAYILLLTAGLYTHYFFPAIIATHAIIMVLPNLRPLPQALRRLLYWLPLPLIALLLYTPWLPIFLRQTNGRPSLDFSAFFQFLVDSGNWLAFGETLPRGEGAAGIVLLVILAVANGRSRTLIPLIATTIPLLFMFAAGSIAAQFFKFLVGVVPVLCLLIGFTIYDLRFTIFRSKLQALRPTLHFFSALLITGYCLLITLSLHNLYTNPAYARADYRGIVARIEAEDHPNAGIILDAPNQWEVFTYYHREGAPVYPLPKSVSQPTPEAIAAELSQIASQHDRLYAIFWGEAQRDPERLVERWLDEHAFKAIDIWVIDVRFVTYAVPAEAAVEMETAVSLPFGDTITLNGYAFNSDYPYPGEIAQVTLFWQTSAPISQRYKIFLHLLDANGQLIAQRDSEPGGGLKPTTTWQPGEVIVDNHGLLIPADAPLGPYTVLLGLYDLNDPNQRLPIQTDTGEVDAFPITTFAIFNR